MPLKNGNDSSKFTAALRENKNCYASHVQREIIVALANQNILQNAFFLTGGTALAVFYLHHRRSNDLDLFTIAPTDLSEIDFSLKSIWKNSYVKIKQSPNFLSVLLQEVKLDFVIDPLSLQEERQRFLLDSNTFLMVDSIRNIGSNKFCTIVSRVEPKDFIDFYFVNRKFTSAFLAAIYEDARKKDAIFDDPPTVAYQIEQGINLIQRNADLLPHLLVEFDLNDFYKFYRDVADWIYRKIEN